MRNNIWKIIGIAVIFLSFDRSASAEGLDGLITVIGENTSAYEDNEKQSETFSFSQFNYIRFGKAVTPAISYNLDLRTRFTNSDTTDAENITTTSHFRAVDPAVSLTLANPMYNVSGGYALHETWTTKDLANEGRTTIEDYFSYFTLTPLYLPSLSLQFSEQKRYDHAETRKTDESSTRYSAGSSYTLPSEDIKLSYNINYDHIVTKTPLKITTESVSDTVNMNYDTGYMISFWNSRATLTVGYQGNLGWNQTDVFASQTGDVLFERTALGGLHATGTTLNPSVDVLNTIGWSSLVDNDTKTGTVIDLNAVKFSNTGIWVSSEKPVDRLFLYVNENIGSDTNLTRIDNWKVYRSNFNLPNTWSEVPVKNVVVTAFDVQDTIYRYEIEFLMPQTASYFKVVNMDTILAPGVTKALITEIEAHGTDTIPRKGKISGDSTSSNQKFSLSMYVRPLKKLSFSFNYFIDRVDQNADSPLSTITGVFKNIFSKSLTGDEKDFSSRVNRSYSVSSTWDAHRLLTTTASYQRYELFDSSNTIDMGTNTYSLSFQSRPLPTLGTNLIFTRSENKDLNEREDENNAVIFSVDSKLYRDINMVTDMVYSQSTSSSVENGTTRESDSSYYSINGTIDAFFTRKLFADFRYTLQWRSADNTSTQLKSAASRVTYRPGRFINLTASFSISDVAGNITTSEDLIIDWLPLPAISLSAGYNHTSSEPGPSTLDTLNTTGTWQITKFMTAQLSYNFARKKADKTNESHSVNAYLNCRF